MPKCLLLHTQGKTAEFIDCCRLLTFGHLENILSKTEVDSEYKTLLLRPFLYLGSAHQVFNLHVLRSCASSIFTCFFSLSLHLASPSQYCVSYFLTYVCHTCRRSYFFCPDLLNPLYSDHTSQHSHFRSF